MVRKRASSSRLPLTVAATAAAVLVTGLATASNAGAAPSSKKLAPGISAKHSVGKQGKARADEARLAGLPKKGNYAFLLTLDTRSTTSAGNSARAKGRAAVKAAAKKQLATVRTAQNKVIDELPGNSRVMYRMHAVLSGVAVRTDVRNYSKLEHLGGVAKVYPIAPKTLSNSYAVPLQGAPQAWKAYGDRGENSTVAVLDTGIDYTHADFGGPGTVEAYETAHAAEAEPADSSEFPSDKIIGGSDLVGDSYQADPNTPGYQPVPHPDPNPLDCNSHGSHVAGTVAGYGENADGSTYAGAYNKNTPFDTMRIGPGMAPLAKLYAFRIFGCEGSTDVTAQAIDMASDPNGDGDTSDHVDVINMSLGSDYGSPQDGDSVATDAASALGITMVVASGNAGDIYDVGGSPGDATTAIAAAASVDAYSQVDALNVSAPASIAGPYAAERSIAYDYTSKPDLSGDVVRLSDPTNLDGCTPLSTADAAAVEGHIAFVEWTDDDATRRCGSAARGANIAAAGATGFIYADDEETFAAGITGDATIPGVLVAKSGGDAIRTELLAGHTVTISGTTANGFKQLDESLNDTVASFSSRGISDAGNVKPDVTAVGASVFSAGSGTGNQGLNDSGTSMATPMTAGAAGLVKSLHPNWTPEQVKADIMNTADADLYTKTDHTGKKYAPNRVGAGRIDVKSALDNQVLAYNSDDTGAVSVSFGTMGVTEDTTLTKHIKVQNTGLASATYDVTYKSRTEIPGVEYSVSPSTVTVGPRSSATVTVTLDVSAADLTKTIDPTVDRDQGGLPRQYQADASGLVMLKGDGPNLRVPVYSAPRPASDMSAPASLTLPGGAVQSALLPLSGQRVNQGDGAENVTSTVAGFELAATSGLAPDCSDTVTENCVNFSDQRAADLKYVGVTSDAPQLESIGEDPLTSPNGLAYFAISTQGAWRTVSGIQEFDIYLDGDGDGTADAVVVNARLTDSDVLVSETIDLNSGDVLDIEGLNDSLGDTDTAIFDSDTVVIPVAIGAIPGVTADHSRINYAIESFSAYAPGVIDTVGTVDEETGAIGGGFSFDVLHPGLAVYGSYNGDTSALLYADSPGSVVQVRRDAAAYAADKGKGALLVHFHNKVGSKAQVTSLNKSATEASLTMSPNPVKRGHTLSGTVTVSDTAGTAPTGSVTLERVSGPSSPATVGTAPLVNGEATVSYTPKSKGIYKYQATYAGDGVYSSASSSAVTVTITT